jgi:hypothetical protein
MWSVLRISNSNGYRTFSMVEKHVDVSLSYSSHYGTHSKPFKQNATFSC